jgi:anti-sigma-K factor RskA
MRFNPAQIDSLAAEYVLGTLHGSGRQRFEQLLTERGDIRQAVWRWERSLNQIACGLKPCSPPRRVWKEIRTRIDATRPAARRRLSWWRSLWLGIPTAAASAWLAVAFLSGPPVSQVEQVAVFSDQNADALWIVSADLELGVIRAEAVSAVAMTADTSFELWVLQADGPPLSLGLLPAYPGTTDTPVSRELASVLAGAGRLAISVEPAGGSPTGLPTGPVVYQASLLKI